MVGYGHQQVSSHDLFCTQAKKGEECPMYNQVAVVRSGSDQGWTFKDALRAVECPPDTTMERIMKISSGFMDSHLSTSAHLCRLLKLLKSSSVSASNMSSNSCALGAALVAVSARIEAQGRDMGRDALSILRFFQEQLAFGGVGRAIVNPKDVRTFILKKIVPLMEEAMALVVPHDAVFASDLVNDLKDRLQPELTEKGQFDHIGSIMMMWVALVSGEGIATLVHEKSEDDFMRGSGVAGNVLHFRFYGSIQDLNSTALIAFRTNGHWYLGSLTSEVYLMRIPGGTEHDWLAFPADHLRDVLGKIRKESPLEVDLSHLEIVPLDRALPEESFIDREPLDAIDMDKYLSWCASGCSSPYGGLQVSALFFVVDDVELMLYDSL